MAATEHLTTEKFLDILSRQCIIRCLVETLPPNANLFRDERTCTTIKLWDVQGDTDGNVVLLETTYTCEEYPKIATYEGFTGIKAQCIGCKTMRTTLRREWNDDTYRNIHLLLGKWLQENPCWLSPKSIVSCRKLKNEEFQEIPSSGLHLMQHYARLQTRLAYEIMGKHEYRYWLCGTFYRLCAFISDQNKQWERVVGGNVSP